MNKAQHTTTAISNGEELPKLGKSTSNESNSELES